MSLRAEILRLALRWFVKRSASPEPNIERARQRLHQIKRFIPGPARGTERTAMTIDGMPALRVAVPQSLPDRHILYLHGGAYAFGSAAYYRDFLWRVAAATRAQVLCIDYRLAPEHRFPAAVDDAVKGYRWLLSEGAEPGRIGFMGDSAGGGLVFATLLRLRDERVPLPAAAVALSPWADLATTGASYRDNAEADPMLSPPQPRYLARCYLGDADPRHPYASPIYGDPAGLPPSLIQAGGDEILRDDAVRMAERLRAAGCQVDLQIWPRMPHAWQLFARILPEGRRAIDEIGAFVERMTANAAA
jgi:acetyl esterase/lipase